MKFFCVNSLAVVGIFDVEIVRGKGSNTTTVEAKTARGESIKLTHRDKTLTIESVKSGPYVTQVQIGGRNNVQICDDGETTVYQSESKQTVGKISIRTGAKAFKFDGRCNVTFL